MTTTDSACDDLLPLADLRRVVGVCDAYEADWRRGGMPRIEALLDGFGSSSRADLLRRLLDLEIELRARSGHDIDPTDYRQRFPTDETIVESALVEFAALPSLAPRRTAMGRYDLGPPLGQGGMGIVYRCTERGSGRVAALKMIRPELLAELPPAARQSLVERFATEAKAAKSLDHEAIVPVLDVDTVDGIDYYTMPLIEGGNLAHSLAAKRPTPREAVRLLGLAARAVHHAHTRGVLHRDLKPSNILLTPDGQPRLTDFGLARLDGPAISSSNVVGTAAYLAPELHRSVGRIRYSVTSDVYSLGATLHEMLLGKPPLAPGIPAAFAKSSDRRLERIVLKCLSPDPRDRYLSAAALADDLDRYLADEPVRARKTARSVLRRWSRTPWTRAVGLATAILLAAGSIAFAFGLRPPGWDEWTYRRQTAPVIRTLDSGTAATLLPADKLPPLRWIFGHGEAHRTPNGELCLMAIEPSLVELLPEVPSDHYEITATLRQEMGYSAHPAAGLYAGHQVLDTPTGFHHGSVQAVFADIGTHLGDGSSFLVEPAILGPSLADPYLHLRLQFPKHQIPYPVANPYAAPAPWRTISLAILGRNVVASGPWSSDTIAYDLPRAQALWLTPQFVLNHPEFAGVFEVVKPRGGLGFFLHGTKIVIRDLQVKPIATPPPL